MTHRSQSSGLTPVLIDTPAPLALRSSLGPDADKEAFARELASAHHGHAGLGEKGSCTQEGGADARSKREPATSDADDDSDPQIDPAAASVVVVPDRMLRPDRESCRSGGHVELTEGLKEHAERAQLKNSEDMNLSSWFRAKDEGEVGTTPMKNLAAQKVLADEPTYRAPHVLMTSETAAKAEDVVDTQMPFDLRAMAKASQRDELMSTMPVEGDASSSSILRIQESMNNTVRGEVETQGRLAPSDAAQVKMSSAERVERMREASLHQVTRVVLGEGDEKIVLTISPDLLRVRVLAQVSDARTARALSAGIQELRTALLAQGMELEAVRMTSKGVDGSRLGEEDQRALELGDESEETQRRRKNNGGILRILA